ncbi:MAG: hypothetical protein GTN36_05980 [Candidatus Aenigmarchaeota archaeon]|nr:hypothetical protein [Candidatus Aenigmarchaeota archaeon]
MVIKIQTYCDRCKKSVKDVGRLTNVKWKGVNLKLCKDCRRRIKIRVR